MIAQANADVEAARRAIRAGVSVISCSDRIEDVEALRGLDGDARRAEVSVLTGVGFARNRTELGNVGIPTHVESFAIATRDRFDGLIGASTATIMAKTGFDQKKIANIIYRLRKQKKIKYSPPFLQPNP